MSKRKHHGDANRTHSYTARAWLVVCTGLLWLGSTSGKKKGSWLRAVALVSGGTAFTRRTNLKITHTALSRWRLGGGEIERKKLNSSTDVLRGFQALPCEQRCVIGV